MQKHADAVTLKDGSGTWACSESGKLVFCSGDADMTLLPRRELFGFGSGDWLDSADAQEEAQNLDRRWFSLAMTADTKVLLEETAELPQDLAQLSFVTEQIVSLGDLLQTLSSLGHLMVKVTHQTVQEENGNYIVKQKDLVLFKMAGKATPHCLYDLR